MPDAPAPAAHAHSPALLRPAPRREDSPALDGRSGTGRGVALALVPSHGRLREELHGRSLGHALHATLTDVPVGLWTSAAVLDLVGGERSAPAAQRLVGLGVLAVAPPALPGLCVLYSSDAAAAERGGARGGRGLG